MTVSGIRPGLPEPDQGNGEGRASGPLAQGAHSSPPEQGDIRLESLETPSFLTRRVLAGNLAAQKIPDTEPESGGPSAPVQIPGRTSQTHSSARRDMIYPKLDDKQIARLAPFGHFRSAHAGEVLFDQGKEREALFVVIKGRVQIVSPWEGVEIPINVQEPGEFTGDVSLISGRRSLVRGRALEASELLEISGERVRHIVQTDPELGEIFLRAFMLRRADLIANTPGNVLLIGSRHSADTLRLKAFLTRNSQPFTYYDVECEPCVEDFARRFNIRADDIPVLMYPGLSPLSNPSNAAAAEFLGFNTNINVPARVHDLIVVGAGPAGLAAAVYAASEGLDVLILEGNAPGGQAGSSSRIENYLGFPAGISGQDLAERALVQAQRFGAQVLIARPAAGLQCQHRLFNIGLTDGSSVQAQSVVVATGVQYRRLALENITQFEGAGVYYGATKLEAQFCEGEEIAVVGGGNSAGQAAVFLSDHAKHVHVLVRGKGLADSMSRYLIRRIEDSPRITLHAHTEIESLRGSRSLEQICWKNARTEVRETRDIRHVFAMTGASPNTAWLQGGVVLDDKQFIKTGPDLSPQDLAAAHWPLRRQPYPFETSLPRVFAVGDIRANSSKRVASSVGEGSGAVQFVHKVLAE